MWNETAKANCSRDSSNADKSIALPSRHKLTDRTRTQRKVPSTVQSRMRSRKKVLESLRGDRDKPTRVRHRDLLRHNDDLDCSALLRAGRGPCRQGLVALNLGLEAVANEIFKS